MQSRLNCVNCRVSFVQAEILPAQSFTIQYKNYVFPLHYSQKNIIQNTINSYLNSQGGVIYLSVQDQTCKVQGLVLNRKQMDQYTRMIVELSQQFYPKVMLRNQAIKIQFIPVLSKAGKFTSKYVPKVIVQKGQSNRLYTYSLQHDLGNKKVLIQMYAFERYQGKIKRFSAFDIQQQIFERAVKPSELKIAFHQGCNPTPSQIKQELKPQPKLQSQKKVQKSKKQLQKSKVEKSHAKEYVYYYAITNIKRNMVDQLVQSIKKFLELSKTKIQFSNLTYESMQSEIFIYGGEDSKKIFQLMHNSLNQKSALSKYGYRGKLFHGFSNLSFIIITDQYQEVMNHAVLANTDLEQKAILNKTKEQNIVVRCKSIQSLKVIYDELREFRPRICFV